MPDTLPADGWVPHDDAPARALAGAEGAPPPGTYYTLCGRPVHPAPPMPVPLPVNVLDLLAEYHRYTQSALWGAASAMRDPHNLDPRAAAAAGLRHYNVLRRIRSALGDAGHEAQAGLLMGEAAAAEGCFRRALANGGGE